MKEELNNFVTTSRKTANVICSVEDSHLKRRSLYISKQGAIKQNIKNDDTEAFRYFWQ
jgi:hypothetical protein